MLSLVIDTSTERGFLAFCKDENILFQALFPKGLNNSKFLLPELQRGFKELKLSPKDLSFVAVGIGPGSYTGIRIGVMVAKSIAYACQIPMVTFSGLESFTSSTDSSFAVILDAKIGGAYVLKHGEDNPQLVSLEKLGDYLKNIYTLVTPNQEVIRNKLMKLYPSQNWFWEENEPNIQWVCQIVSNKFTQGKHSDGRHVELLYLRKTQAEIEKDQNT